MAYFDYYRDVNDPAPSGPGIRGEQPEPLTAVQRRDAQSAYNRALASNPLYPGNPANVMARAQTARQLDALRQALMRGQRTGTTMLRHNLASRGMMDSGSLGAGSARLAINAQDRAAEGTQAALSGESERLMALLQAEQQRQAQQKLAREGWMQQASLAREGWQHASRESALDRAFREQMARWGAAQEKNNQPTGWEQLLGGVGAAVGGGLPIWLLNLLGSNSAKERR